MQRRFIAKFTAGALSAVLFLLLVYQLPPVKSSLGWRVDFTLTYLRGILYPADRMPTPRPSPTLDRQAVLIPTATQQPATAPAPTPTPLPPAVKLDPPGFEQQTLNNCGPAALAGYLRYFGWEGDQTAVAEVVKEKTEDRNVNVEELAYFVRTHAGWLHMEYRVGMGLEQIKRFLAAGIPVVIEETFLMDAGFWPNDDLWAGHYLLITGYNDTTGVVTTQDTYYGPNRPVTYADLDRNWKAFNRVLLLVYPPEQAETVRAILGPDWDPDANRRRALLAAEAETRADPQDAFAWFNVGTNLVYFDRSEEAAQAYDTARSLGLPQRMLRYQFGPFLAYFHSGRTDDLLALTRYALQRTPNAEEALLWHGWALYRQGDIAGAEADFRKALDANATYQDAKYALQFLGNP